MRLSWLALLLLALPACSKSQPTPTPAATGASQNAATPSDPLQDILQQEGRLLIDVRTPPEFASGHVPGSINLPLSDIDAIAAKLGAKDQPAVLFCRTGNRSGQAIRVLQRQGFTRLVNGNAAPDLAAKMGVQLVR